ncbi:Membrane fusion protein of RND family multidrug efflux pump [Hyphomicrobium sulfonivorans]|uniref:Membrane fusion protein of RND family multidrug efflux pump n=1 Tax=Hyphomicrobium sulfonivorans TaxID=121290 RepID=A0A109BEM2_HYPSL|nr:efflux RND transporter periplasmic adaptor subunit [Hyphomicrobium sulfonivorans]KWT66707.1 Membrane fusion protein of RND family multidrug efflux pump [Hyphomicrobium sulfonivorans]
MKRVIKTLLLLAILGGGAYFFAPQIKPYIAPLLAAVTGQQTPIETASLPPDAAKLTPPPAVTVIKAQHADFTAMVTVSGSLIPRDEILVTPEVEGFRVLQLNVDEGDRVKQGDVLAVLVQESLEAQLAQNAASLARAEAAIAQARSQIVEATARREEAEANFNRAKPLKNSGFLSGSTYDQREAAAKSTAAQFKAAEDGLRVAEADKLQIEAQRRELQWKHANTKVTSPADGLISRRTARIGGMASGVGEPMFRIIYRGEVELDAEVIETDIGKIANGQKAVIDVAGVGPVQGTVRLVSPEVDRQTRLGRVRIFLGDDARLRIGAFARGTITTGRSHGIAVPSAAVIFDPSGAYVQVVNDNRVERRDVKPGLISGGLVEILEGVGDGDVIVARAGSFLRSGDQVRPVLPDSKISEAR